MKSFTNGISPQNPLSGSLIPILLLALITLAAVLRPMSDQGHTLPRAPVAMAAPARRRNRPVPASESASYARYSSDLQDDTTIESQHLGCRNLAVSHGQAINPALEYRDDAISGTKLHREGLDELLEAAKAGKYNRLYFYSLSRLARESIIGMPILKHLVYNLKIRVFSVTEGLDTNNPGWEMLAQMLLMHHERYIKDLSANVFRGQVSNVHHHFSNGDYCFGFISVPSPGGEQTGRGRRARPRMVYAIDPVTSEWVQRIFEWFVVERWSIRAICRELNRLGAPKDHRSSKPHWHHQYVTRLLANPKYIGDWAWGERQNERDPMTGQVSQVDRAPEEIEQFRRRFPHLRLIDDATFAAAQARLAENRATCAEGRSEKGTFVKGRQGAAPPANHLLSGLIECGECRRTFYVGGGMGKYLYCPGHHQGVCTCQTTLRRDLAEGLILGEISSRILTNPAWFNAVLTATRTAWQQLQQTLPNELRDVQAALDENGRKVARLLDQIEGSEQPDPAIAVRLAERRAERRTLEQRLAAAQSANSAQIGEPTEDWVRERLAHLDDVLREAGPAAAHALQGLLGETIVVQEIRRPSKQRHYLQGTFQIQLGGVLTALGATAASTQAQDVPAETITIDFVRENSRDSLAEQVKRLWDEGVANKEIARQMGCWPSIVTKLLGHWSRRHGIPLPDGRSLRGQRKGTPPGDAHGEAGDRPAA